MRDILFIEDNDDIRECLTSILESEGYFVVALASAEEGLDALRNQTFQLLITDYMLPRRNGQWLIEESLERGYLRQTRAMMITAHPTIEKMPGNVRVIQKPLEVDVFLQLVRDAMASQYGQLSS